MKGMRPSLGDLFDKLHPEYSFDKRQSLRKYLYWWACFHSTWYECRNAQDAWIRKVTGLEYDCWNQGKPPKSLRRCQNKIHRAKIRQAMKVVNDGEYYDWHTIMTAAIHEYAHVMDKEAIESHGNSFLYFHEQLMNSARKMFNYRPEYPIDPSYPNTL